MSDIEKLIEILESLSISDLLEEWELMRESNDEYDPIFKDILFAVIAEKIKKT